MHNKIPKCFTALDALKSSAWQAKEDMGSCFHYEGYDSIRNHWETISTNETLIALREYESRVRTFTNQLISVLDSKTGQSIDASRWFNFYSFDIMGDMAFGKSFDMMKSGEKVRIQREFSRRIICLLFLAFCDRDFTRSHETTWGYRADILAASTSHGYTRPQRPNQKISTIQ